MSDTNPQEPVTDGATVTDMSEAAAKREVDTNFKGATPAPGEKAKSARAKKAAKTTKKVATDRPAIDRRPSVISKDGTQKDTFTGEVLPVTAFPTIKGADGTFSKRGTVARKNLEAYRAAKRTEREAAKVAKDAAAKATAKANKATKAAAK